VNNTQLEKCRTLNNSEDWAGLERQSRSYVKADKRDIIAWLILARALEKQHSFAEQLSVTRQALKLDPNNPEAHFNHGCALRNLGYKQESLAYFRRATEIKPDYAEAWCNLGNALQRVGQPYEALRAYYRGIKLAPNLLDIQLNMGNCYMTIGQHDQALRFYQLAIDIAEASKITYIEAYNASQFAKDLVPAQTVETCQADRRLWNAKFADGLREDKPHLNNRDPERGLRIGYVSGDFRGHSAARAFGAVVLNHDRAEFEIFAYSNTKHDADIYTKVFKEGVDHWKDISLLSDQAFADLVRSDQIDILVDLSGHTGANRLLSFARKPAPIQCTGWGYAVGTGLPTMDVFFADPVIVPESERHLYAEEVRYLPCVVGSYWVEEFPEVLELPASVRGNITFGSLNRFAKVTEDTMRLWAKVLLAVPNSVMAFKAGELEEEAHRERVMAVFKALGIPSTRLMFMGGTDWHAHMEVYNEIDIALDPFPHGGGVTTLEALMMGVPVITLRWPTVPGRLSSSILTAMQMTDWIAESQDDYIALAIEKADDLKDLTKTRQGLRARFQASPIGDGPAYCRAVEEHFRQLWRRWCAHKVVDKQEIAA